MKKGFYSIQTKSMADYGVANQKELWEKVKAEGYKGLAVTVKSTFEKEAGTELYHATFSSSNVDRHGDIVMQVFDLKGFMNNPVYLDSHNYDSIEHIIGRILAINTNGGGLNGDIEFCLDNPKGALAEKMVAKGFLNTSSIGFIPLVFDNDGNILESELLEISAVSVPANADALMDKKEVKAVGDVCVMDDGSEGAIIEEDGQMVCRAKVEEKKIEVQSEEKEVVVPLVVVPAETKKRSIAKVVSRLAQEKQKNFDLISKLAHEMVMEGKKERARKLHQIIRELSK